MVALLAKTESESFHLVFGALPSGLEALGRLVRRWDPLSGALLRQILVPDWCQLQDLPAGLDKWEELVRRYERSKSSGTTAAALEKDIKTFAFEALVPSELEQHLAMNRARLTTYEQVRSEIQAYIEARRSQIAFKTVVPKSTSDPVEVDSFGKGSKKGKKGKGDVKNGKKESQHQNPNPSKDVVCWHCGNIKRAALEALVL